MSVQAKGGRENHKVGDSKLSHIDKDFLVAHAKSGHVSAFGALYEPHQMMAYHSVFRIVRNRSDGSGLSVFLSARARLFGIAYRILKNATEAEDILQDVWIQWQVTDRSAVRDAAAFLTTMTTRLAINVIRSARSSRETSAESSMREPAHEGPNPQKKAERSEALRSAFLVLFQKLSPRERAVYVLREAFDYSYREIANILCLRESNARQLVARARQHVVNDQHYSVNSEEQRRFFDAFAAAAQKGALKNFESFLACSVDARRAHSMPQRRWRLLPQLDAKVA
jgi:RNA polymerase sigma-70 factor (ECF subfamily)